MLIIQAFIIYYNLTLIGKTRKVNIRQNKHWYRSQKFYWICSKILQIGPCGGVYYYVH